MFTSTLKHRALLAGATLIVGGAAAGVALSASSPDSKGLGQNPESDLPAKTVIAQPGTVPSEADAQAALESSPLPSVDVKSRLAGLRTERTEKDRLPDNLPAPLPGVKRDAEASRRFSGVAGTEDVWVVPDTTGKLIELVGASGRTSVLPAADVAQQRLLRTFEILPKDPGKMAILGFLTDDVQSAWFSTRSGREDIKPTAGFYSQTFAKTPDHLPRQLHWTDAGGEHAVDVPLSPDLQ